MVVRNDLTNLRHSSPKEQCFLITYNTTILSSYMVPTLKFPTMKIKIQLMHAALFFYTVSTLKIQARKVARECLYNNH